MTTFADDMRQAMTDWDRASQAARDRALKIAAIQAALRGMMTPCYHCGVHDPETRPYHDDKGNEYCSLQCLEVAWRLILAGECEAVKGGR
jgi:anti-sigma factor RsiW